MKYILVFITALFITFLASIYTLTKADTPEIMLLGKWEELSSEYELVSYTNDDSTTNLTKAEKEEISKDLVIHQAELWQFDQQNNLLLHKPNAPNEGVEWNIKGRGNILELRHSDNTLEDYQIIQLTEDELVIHLSFDLQIKGIVKMKFKKVKEEDYVAQL